MAKTGGGHGAVADAVAQALEHVYGEAVEASVVDGLRSFAPFPFSHIDSTYPWQVKLGGDGYGAAWRALNDAGRARLLMKSTWPLVRSATLKIVEQPVDAIVSVHPLFVFPCLWAMHRTGRRLPFITMVSDLVAVHALWCNPETDCLLAPTDISRLQAIDHGIPAEKIQVTGLPIRLQFAEPNQPRPAARAQLGLLPQQRTVLLMGGGDGMGNLGELARTVGFAGLDLQLLVVAGRNKKLEHQLKEIDWPAPTHIYGFTQDIPALMNAADVLISKAGPTTVAEALARELPTILSGFIPSQEEENVTYMVNAGAGVLAEQPDQIIATLKAWLEDADTLAQMSAAARAAAYPRAAFDAAEAIYRVTRDTPLIIQKPRREPLLAALERFLAA
ncbi:MAG TPA: glycosyltransferase [Anaerolineae bacterium]|nr:glycosyltransferase [Anaerolineae bacterium]